MAKEKPEFNIHSDKNKIAELIRTCSEHKTRIELENEGIKAAKAAAKELGVEPKKFGQLLKMYHDHKRDEMERESTEVIDLFDSIFNKGFVEEE